MSKNNESTPLSKVDNHIGDDFAEKFIKDNTLHGKTAEYVRMAISTYRTQHPDPAMVDRILEYIIKNHKGNVFDENHIKSMQDDILKELSK